MAGFLQINLIKLQIFSYEVPLNYLFITDFQKYFRKQIVFLSVKRIDRDTILTIKQIHDNS